MANWAKLQEDLTGLKVVKRAKHGIHFDKGDGQILANFSGKPCHFLDGKIWKPIDTKLLLLPDGFYGCPHSPVKVSKDGRVKVEGSDYQQFTELPSAKVGVLDGDRIVREFPGGKQYLYVTENGFKEEIVVEKPTFPLEKFIAKTSGALPSKYKENPLTAVDAKDNSYEFTGDVTEFGKWLDKAAYPVTIDPDFAGGTADRFIYNTNADYAIARATSGAELSATDYMRIGQVTGFIVYRGYVLFDTSSIGAGATVTQVNLKMTVRADNSDTDFNVLIAKCDWSSGTREEQYDACLAADLDDGSFGNTGTGTWTENTLKTSGNLSTAWINKTGTTYYGILSEEDRNNSEPTNNERILFQTANHATESYRPVLTVTYTAAGGFHPINMSAQMQSLTGGMRG